MIFLTKLILNFSANDDDSLSELGNAKKDQFYLEIEGLDQIDFGTKNMEACIESVQVGVIRTNKPDFSQDYTGCLTNQYYVGG